MKARKNGGLLRSQAVGRNIREAASVEVREIIVVVFGIWVDVVPEIVSDGLLLVPWPTEVIAEASGASFPCDFRRDGLGTANSEDVWT